jgi:alpha-L-fucosidase
MGMKEVCLTARHAGGFAMWPSKFTDYGVSASSRWAATRKAQGKSIDILREFADAANKWGIKIW